MLSFVPFVPPVSTPPSPRANELGRILADTIRAYERDHPSVSRAEVRTALRLAAERRANGERSLVTGLLVGLLVVGAVVWIVVSRGGWAGATIQGSSWIALLIVVGLVLAGMALWVGRRSP